MTRARQANIRRGNETSINFRTIELRCDRGGEGGKARSARELEGAGFEPDEFTVVGEEGLEIASGEVGLSFLIGGSTSFPQPFFILTRFNSREEKFKP